MEHWPAFYGCAIAVAAVGAYTDTRSGRIPNWLTVPALLIAPLIHGLTGGLPALAFALLGAAVCALVPYLMFRKGAAGGGDVKLLAAIGAIAGVQFGVEAELLSFMVAAFYSLARFTWHGELWAALARSARLCINPLLPARHRAALPPQLMHSVRLGVPILAGCLVAGLIRLPLL